MVSIRQGVAQSVIAWLSVVATTALAQDKHVLMTAGRETPPFFELAGERMMGLCPDLLEAMSKSEPRLAWRGVDRVLSFPLLEKSLTEGGLDVVCAMGRNPTRDRVTEDIGIVAIGNLALAVKKGDDTGVGNVADLIALSKRERLLVRRGTQWVQTLRSLGATVGDEATENEAMVRMVAAGRARMAYSFDYVLARAIAKERLEEQLAVARPNLGIESLHLLASKRLPDETVALLRKTFLQLKRSGELDRMQRRYGLAGE